MTPFSELRSWLRRGPTSQRVAAALALLVALPLLVWGAIPAPTDDEIVAGPGIGDTGAAATGQPGGTGGDAGAQPIAPTPDGSAAESLDGGGSPASFGGAGADANSPTGPSSAGAPAPTD